MMDTRKLINIKSYKEFGLKNCCDIRKYNYTLTLDLPTFFASKIVFEELRLEISYGNKYSRVSNKQG